MTAERGGIPPDAGTFRVRVPIENMKPYHPPTEGRTEKDYLLLDFNERTRDPHPLVIQALINYAQEGNFQIYPEYGDLDNVIANYAGVKPEEIIPTLGADSGIDIVTRAIVADGDLMIIPRPTFAMLEQSANIQGAEIISPRYRESNLEFPFGEVIEAIKPGLKMVVLCNPNNPTGTPIPNEQTEEIIDAANKVGAGILVDEAYHEFARDLTVVNLINKYPNLFIVRSLSKSMGISSLRAGYIISSKDNILELRKIRGPYDLPTPTAQVIKTLRHQEVVDDINDYVDEVMNVSKPVIEEFYREHNIPFYPSSAGFHLLEEPMLYDFLRQRNGLQILVRPRSDPAGTVRVSIGTREDTQKYLEAFREFIKQTK